jgi:hypothetical protein
MPVPSGRAHAQLRARATPPTNPKGFCLIRAWSGGPMGPQGPCSPGAARAAARHARPRPYAPTPLQLPNPR